MVSPACTQILLKILLATSFVGSGSLNTIINKICYQTISVNKAGQKQYFDRPWLNTFIMFLAEFTCMPVFGIMALIYRRIPEKEPDDSMTEEERAEKKKFSFITRDEVFRNPTGGLKWKYPLYITLFAACDLTGTTLSSIGLQFCDASVILIVKGFTLVWTMLLAWPFLHRKPKSFQLLGVTFAVIGLILVGVSAVCSNKAGNTGSMTYSAGNTILGIGLSLAGQVFSAIQFTLEEKLLKQDNGEVAPIPPLFLVGSEGLAGSILCAAIALPVVNAIKGDDFGSYENLSNSFYMLFHNPFICGMNFLLYCSILIYNWSGFVFSKALSAVTRTIVDCLKTISVWIIMIICYYCTNAVYGEPVSTWSILEVAGFIFMIFGTITHNNIRGFGMLLTKPCTKLEKEEGADESPEDVDEKKLKKLEIESDSDKPDAL